MLHKKLLHLICFALKATNYFNVFMSTMVLLGLTSFEKNWGPVDFWGASNFSNLLAPWASGSRSLMGHFFNMATIQEETAMKKNHEKGTFVNCHEHV